MAVSTLLVAVRTTGANQLRNLSTGFRRASASGRAAATQLRRDFDQATDALRRANAQVARARLSGNANELHLMTLRARLAARAVDDLADQIRQANRASRTFAGGLGALFSTIGRAGSNMPAASKLVGGLAAGIAALAPVLGAALQGALLAGLGGIGLGAAIFAAFKDEDIKSAFTSLFKDIGTDLKVFGKQLGPDLVASADSFRMAWAHARDFVRDLFGDLSRAIGPLTSGLIAMAREAGPGIKQAFAAAVPVLIELGRMLPTLGRGIGSFFESISESGDGALKGLRVLVLAVAGSLMILGKVVQGLSAWFDFWSDKAGAVYSALAKIPLLGKAFEPLASVFEKINKPADETTGALKILNGTQLATAQAARQAADEMHRLSERMHGLVNAQLDADQSMVAWHAGLTSLTEAIKGNGRSLDVTKKAGQENLQVIMAQIGLAEQARVAAINLAGGEKATATAVADANAKFRSQLGELESVLLKLGFTKTQVDGLLSKYRDLANAPSINKNITFTYRTAGDIPRDQRVGVPGGKVGYAKGVRSAPPGWAWTGEEGPELVRFRGGETVLTAEQSAGMGRGGAGTSWSGGGYGAPNLTLQIDAASTGIDRVFSQWVEQLFNAGRIRLRAGNTPVMAR